MWMTIAFQLIGGIGLVLYGMHVMSEGLKKACGNKLRSILSNLTNNPIIGLFAGIVITVVFQSSSATSVFLVGLTNSAIITLQQSLAVMLGAGIGTSITAQLIALKITEIALPIIGVGAVVIFFCKRQRHQNIGLAIIGFGLLFLGLKLMSDAMYPLRDNPYFVNTLMQLSDRPILAFLVAIAFTIVINSSAAAIGMIMVLYMQGSIELIPALYMLLGANVGTPFTAILASLSAIREAQRVAVAFFLFKVVGALIFIPFITYLAEAVKWLTPTALGFQIANAHLIFNIVLAVILIPFTKQLTKIIKKLVPDKLDDSKEIKPKYIDDTLIDTPALAIGMAHKEALRITDMVTDLVTQSNSLFKKYNQDKVDELLQKEEHIDKLFTITNEYLTKIMQQKLCKDNFNKSMGILNIVKDYEHIGDIVEKNIIYKAESKHANNTDFSEDGYREITNMQNTIVEMLHLVNTAVENNSCQLVERAKKLYEDVVEMEFRYRMSHFARLQMGKQASINTSSIHLDLINSYLKIADHLNNVCSVLTDEVSCTWHDEIELIYGPQSCPVSLSKD